jgi:hypothetical protein
LGCNEKFGHLALERDLWSWNIGEGRNGIFHVPLQKIRTRVTGVRGRVRVYPT